MERADLSPGHLIRSARERLQGHWGLTIAVVVLSGLSTSGLSISVDSTRLSVRLVELFVGGPICIGAYAYGLRLWRTREGDLSRVFDGFKRYGNAVLTYLAYSVAIVVGCLLLVVPGVIIALGFWPALYLVLDEEHDVPGNFRRAWALTDGYKLQLLVLWLCLAGVNLLGLLFFVVGVVFTMALSLVVCAAAYDELKRAAEFEVL